MLSPGDIMMDGQNNAWVVESPSDRRHCYWFWLRFRASHGEFLFRNSKINTSLKLMNENDLHTINNGNFNSEFVTNVTSIFRE
jgi:hypothetical protein